MKKEIEFGVFAVLHGYPRKFHSQRCCGVADDIVRAGYIQTVIVYKLDRNSHSILDFSIHFCFDRQSKSPLLLGYFYSRGDLLFNGKHN